MHAHFTNSSTEAAYYHTFVFCSQNLNMPAADPGKGGMCLYVGSVPIGQLNKQAGSSKSTNALHSQTVSTGQHPTAFLFCE